MRKIIIGIISIVFIILLISKLNHEDEEIRVRIISNGNKASDLKDKKIAKDLTICYLNIIYHAEYDKFKNNIEETYDDLENMLLEEGISANVSFSYHTLYNKTYNNNAIKNDSKLTLYVILGKGEGENWWGSVYPKFLSISSEEEIKYESLIMKVLGIKENCDDSN